MLTIIPDATLSRPSALALANVAVAVTLSPPQKVVPASLVDSKQEVCGGGRSINAAIIHDLQILLL